MRLLPGELAGFAGPAAFFSPPPLTWTWTRRWSVTAAMEDTKKHRLRRAASAATARRRIKPPQNSVTQTRPGICCFTLTRSHTRSMITYHFGSVQRNKSLPSQRYQTARCTHGQRKENLGTFTVSLQLLHIYPTPPPAALWLCLTAEKKNPQKSPHSLHQCNLCDSGKKTIFRPIVIQTGKGNDYAAGTTRADAVNIRSGDNCIV